MSSCVHVSPLDGFAVTRAVHLSRSFCAALQWWCAQSSSIAGFGSTGSSCAPSRPPSAPRPSVSSTRERPSARSEPKRSSARSQLARSNDRSGQPRPSESSDRIEGTSRASRENKPSKSRERAEQVAGQGNGLRVSTPRFPLLDSRSARTTTTTDRQRHGIASFVRNPFLSPAAPTRSLSPLPFPSPFPSLPPCLSLPLPLPRCFPPPPRSERTPILRLLARGADQAVEEKRRR